MSLRLIRGLQAYLLSLPLLAGASRFWHPPPVLPRVLENLQFIIPPPFFTFLISDYYSQMFVNKYFSDPLDN